MKVLILFVSLSVFTQFQAQTPLIAHKSHSGNLSTYFVDPNSNFGEIQMFPENYKTRFYTSLNDSLVLRQTSNGYTVIQIDTLKNEQRELLISFQQEDLRRLQLKEDSIQKVSDSLALEQYKMSQENNEKNLTPIISTPKKNNSNPSFLLVLFGVSAMLMLLMRMFMRDKKAAIV